MFAVVVTFSAFCRVLSFWKWAAGAGRRAGATRQGQLLPRTPGTCAWVLFLNPYPEFTSRRIVAGSHWLSSVEPDATCSRALPGG